MQNPIPPHARAGLLPGLLILFITSSITCFAQGARVQKWREDLDFMVRQLEIRHADMYGNVSREDFSRARRRIDAAIPKLTDGQVLAEFARLVAMIGDGHTSIFFWSNRQQGFRRYPVEYWYAKDGLIVLAAAPEYKRLVGLKVKRIGSGSVEEVVKAIKPLLPLDNQFAVRKLASLYIRVPELLSALGFVRDMEQMDLTLEDVDGKEVRAKIGPVPIDARPEWQFIGAKETLPLWLRRRSEKYWFEYLKEPKAVYLQFNSADVGVGRDEDEFIAFCERLVQTIRTEDVEKLIVDLRWNSGGNYDRTRHILNAVIRSEKINQPGKLFTIISNNTFSAAVMQAVRLEEFTHTIFVGEPTSGRPNHSGELRRFFLPNNNGVEVRYSAMYEIQSNSGDKRPAIMPDLKAELTAADYRSGEDPAMKAIFAYKPKISPAAMLRDTIATKGIDAGVDQYKQLKERHFNEYDLGEPMLTRLAYDVLEAKQTEAAVALLRLAVEEFSYSANAYYNLAHAYETTNKPQLAIINYRRAFEIDRRYTNALENMERLQRIKRIIGARRGTPIAFKSPNGRSA